MDKDDDNNNIAKLWKQNKINMNEDEQLQNEIKKGEVESTKGGKLNKTTKTKNIN